MDEVIAVPAATVTPMDARIKALLTPLNFEQRQAVITTEGAVQVVAGAGTGKTNILTRRIANIILAGKAEPHRILAVTFTNKAANEMCERIDSLLGSSQTGVEAGNFHSTSLRMLRYHAKAAGLRDETFMVIDEDDQRTLVEEAMRAIHHEADPSRTWKDEIKLFHARIQFWKEEGWTVENAARKADLTHEDNAKALKIYGPYQAELLKRNVCDFADLILHMVVLFRTEPTIRKFWSSRYKYILVDEFQDTNPLQYEWIRHLASASGNIFVVGDLDQCIYQWRNARPEIFNSFSADWKGCRIITVHRNYRSSQPILDVANAVVNATHRPHPKVLTSNVEGKPVVLDGFDFAQAEAEAIASRISQLISAGETPAEIAILLRAAYPMRIIEQKLHAAGIHYTVVGGVKFYDREEIRDAITYLRIFHDPTDELSFRRICNKPARNIGDTTADKVIGAYRMGAPDLAAACRDVASNGQRITKAARDNLNMLADLIAEGTAMYREADMAPAIKPLSDPGQIDDALHPQKRVGGVPVGNLIQWMLEKTDYLRWRRSIGDEKAEEREENLIELVSAANEYTDVTSFLQHVSLMSAADEAGNEFDAVRLSTIHAAKGLEFNVVFSPCLEEGILPHARALAESHAYGLDEERRIAHVAWTRARKELYVSYSRYRNDRGAKPSEFLVDAGLMTEEEANDMAYAPPPQRRQNAYGQRRMIRRRF